MSVVVAKHAVLTAEELKEKFRIKVIVGTDETTDRVQVKVHHGVSQQFLFISVDEARSLHRCLAAALPEQ